MRTQAKKFLSRKILSSLLALAMVFGMIQYTIPPAAAAAVTNFTLCVTDKAGVEQPVGTWTYDSENKTFIDTEGTEAPFVRDFTGSEVLRYSGKDMYIAPRMAVCTRGIFLSDLLDYASNAAGIPLNDDTTVKALPFMNGYPYSDFLNRYYYPSYIMNQGFNDTGKTAVSTVLAVYSYNQRNLAGSANQGWGSATALTALNGGVEVPVAVDEDSLEYAFNILTQGADDDRSLRLLLGQSENSPGDANLGNRSTYNVTSVVFTPVYLGITVNVTNDDGSGATAVVATDDGYAKAAAGEAVSFTVTDVTTGYGVDTVSVSYGGEGSVEVSETGGVYSFTMPDAAAAVNVSLTSSASTYTPPALTPDTTNNIVGQAADITFTTDAAWEAAISGITVNGTALTGGQYTVAPGSINIAASAFSAPGDHIIIVTAAGYEDATVIQTIVPAGPQVPVTVSLSPAAAQAGETVTASGTGPANTWISLKALDAGQNIVVFDAVKSDSQGNYSLTFVVPDADGEALTVIAGYGANVAPATLSLKLNPPALQADTDNNVVGQSIDITFNTDAAWQAAISGITVNGAPLTIGQYTVSAGNINISSAVFTAVGDYSVTVTAGGYKDASVTQTMAAKTPPTLAADSSDNTVGQAIDLTFAENADWQAAVSGITVNGSPLTGDQYTVSAGNINIIAGAFSAAGSYEIIVSATNYTNAAVVQQMLGTAPELVADITNNSPGQTIEITFADNEAWRGAITDVTVDGVSIAGKYTATAGVITLDNTVFTAAGSFSVVVKTTGYADATVTQAILNPCYLITPEADDIYIISENQDGIKIMTVNAGVSGMKYFNVGVTPVRSHNGKETLVFVHLRDGQQASLNTSIGDFDLIDGAGAGFNVSSGNVVKVYMVDQLTNAIDFNPIIFQ